MTTARKLLLGIMALVIALAPAVASAATSARKHTATASGQSTMEHCHKAAPGKGTPKHCNHCADDSGCTPDVCALKCFKVVADVATPQTVTRPLPAASRPANLHEPASWAATPPAPPPRA